MPTTARKKTSRKTTGRKKAATNRKSGRRWSARVAQTSDALDIKQGTFALDDPKKIARELKKDAEQSHRRKSDPYRSAMSMLTFFINRAGKNLPAKRKATLEKAKDELRAAFGKEPRKPRTTARAGARRRA